MCYENFQWYWREKTGKKNRIFWFQEGKKIGTFGQNIYPCPVDDLKSSGSISDVNVNNPTKCCQVSMLEIQFSKIELFAKLVRHLHSRQIISIFPDLLP